MAAGNSNFFTVTNASAVNGTYTAAGGVSYSGDSAEIKNLVSGGYATAMDFSVTTAPGLAGMGLAKGAGLALTFTGTTPITINVAALAADATNGVLFGGDSAFALVNRAYFKNISANSISWAPGAANGLVLGVTAVNAQVPSVSIAAAANGINGEQLLQSSVGYTVNATNKNWTFTPTNAGTLLVTIGGS